MKKVYTENLPKKKYKNIDVIDWKHSVGCDIPFEYNEIIGIVKITDYNNRYLYVKYLDKKPFKIYNQSFSQGCIGMLVNAISCEFSYNIGDVIIDNKRNILIIDKYYNNKNVKCYKYHCNKCGNEDNITEYNITNKQGCNCCANQKLVKGINDVATTNPELLKYFVNIEDAYNYTSGSYNKIKVKCPDCGKIKDQMMTIHNLTKYNSVNCVCSDKISYPEKFINNFLSQLQYKYIYQLGKSNVVWIRNKIRYDFAILDKSCIVEVNGKQHYENSFAFLGGRTVEEEQINDEFKKQLAKNNGIHNYIILDARKSNLEWIKKSIMNSELPVLLNFVENDINWSQCHEYALSNLVKKSCNLRNNNPNITNEEISNLLKISIKVVEKYFKTGFKLGWCK